MARNGSSVARDFDSVGASATTAQVPSVTEVLDLKAGDYIEMYVYQNQGSSLNTDTGTDFAPRMSVVQLNVSAGADLGEIYYTTDPTLHAGEVVQIDPSLRAGVRRATATGGNLVLGVLSTQPSLVMGGLLPGQTAPGREVILALAGNVAANLVLVPSRGIAGAAIATLLTELIVTAGCVYALARRSVALWRLAGVP